MMLESPESHKIAEWRERAIAGTLTAEETRAWIAMVRQGRVSAQTRSTASRAKKAPVDVSSLMDELDNL
jgi:hypothetical protein